MLLKVTNNLLDYMSFVLELRVFSVLTVAFHADGFCVFKIVFSLVSIMASCAGVKNLFSAFGLIPKLFLYPPSSNIFSPASILSIVYTGTYSWSPVCCQSCVKFLLQDVLFPFQQGTSLSFKYFPLLSIFRAVSARCRSQEWLGILQFDS